MNKTILFSPRSLSLRTCAAAAAATASAALLLVSCGEEEVYNPSADRTTVEMKTSMGTITIELFDKRSPITVKNFLNYVKKGHYDGTVFHRVMPNLVVQGGGFEPGENGVLIERPTDPAIKNEGLVHKLKNMKGAISMARTSNPDSATSQFFLNFKDNPSWDLNPNRPGSAPYTVFGKVTKGMDVINRIRMVKTGDRKARQRAGGSGELGPEMPLVDVPRVDVVIQSVRVVEK